MDSRTGKIFYEADLENGKLSKTYGFPLQTQMAHLVGQLTPFEIGETVKIKDCYFKIKEIKVDPENTILLQGEPSPEK